jgi:hypothetical protein
MVTGIYLWKNLSFGKGNFLDNGTSREGQGRGRRAS